MSTFLMTTVAGQHMYVEVESIHKFLQKYHLAGVLYLHITVALECVEACVEECVQECLKDSFQEHLQHVPAPIGQWEDLDWSKVTHGSHPGFNP